MQNNNIAYPILSNPLETSIGNLKYPGEGVTILVSDRENTVEFKLDQNNIASFFERINNFNNYHHYCQHYSVIAIRNLIKKNEYLQLHLQLSQNLIDEKEFEDEVKHNEEKYLIRLSPLKNSNEIHIISDIVKKVGVDMSIDDVGEIFSIDPNSFNSIK